jgi:heterodisulfide reductase subunit A-like polyferredoxin
MSSLLLQKSEENLNSARFLLDESVSHFNSSTQCSYYGCLQVVIHTLILKFGSESNVKDRFEQYKDDGHKGNTHAFYITELRTYIRNAGFKKFAQEFNKTMFELRNLREDASYHQKIVDQANSQAALDKAVYLSDSLKRVLKLQP